MSKQPSILRTAHGAGAGALLRAETPPIDEVPPPNADDTAAGLATQKRRGKPFTKGNRAAAGRRPALAQLGITLPADHPRYRRAMRQADAYRRRRCSELAVQNAGHLSAGAASMIASSARALAASIVLHELAEETLRAGHAREGAALLGQALRAADMSRQAELTAVALAEREAPKRPAWMPPTPPRPALPSTERTPPSPELLEQARRLGVIK